jgi:hypothetical protein
MSMSAAVLSADILTRWKADPACGFSSPLSIAQNAILKAQADAIAAAVIAHVTSFAAVTVTVASVSGVTAGPGVSGPGTGTGTIS